MTKFLNTIAGLVVYILAKLTDWAARILAVLFYLSFILHWKEVPDATMITICVFAGFVIFAAVHCWWMWFFYRVNVLGEMFHARN